MPAPTPPRLTFLGHSCAASAAALESLLEALQDGPLEDVGRVTTVVLAGAPGIAPGAVERLAAAAGVPVVWVASAAEVASALGAAAPALAVAACFPWRLPLAARQIPLLGVLNIHPSLLPAGRGPQPLFWTLRRGERQTGVSVHRMDAGFDSGPLVAQEAMPVPPEIRITELEQQLMARGARLLGEALPALASGTLRPWPQPAHGVSQAPEPAAADWAMVSSLPAAWAWRFARGVAPLDGPLTAIAAGQAIPVADALDWSADERLAQAVMAGGQDTVLVRFSPGWVRFRRRDPADGDRQGRA